jgi:hypothetical protein
MKLLTKEQEAEHYRQTLIGGTTWGIGGLAIGFVGVAAAQRRYHFFRSLTLPLKAFLVTSAGTFAGIVGADHYSRQYEAEQNPKEMEFRRQQAEQAEKHVSGQTFTERAMEFGRKERYKIVGGSWIASMVIAFALVNRNKFLTGQQKIVQARVYAQFLTVGVLIATAAFEIADQRSETGRYETVRYIDPKDPEHKRMLEKRVETDRSNQGGTGNDAMDNQWKQMIKDEEERLKAQEERHKQYEKEHHKKQNNSKNSKKQEAEPHDEEKSEGEDEEQNDGKDEKKDGGKSEKKDKKGKK